MNIISTFGATPEQAQTFMELYQQQKRPLRAAAAAVGINIIQATGIARASGYLRLTEAAIVNSKAGELGRIGEELFQDLLPEAINCNLAVHHANPNYDFLLDGLKIDIKTSCSAAINTKTNRRRFVIRCKNKLKTDLFVVFLKNETENPTDKSRYRHALIVPSLMLMEHKMFEVSTRVLEGEKLSWSEFLFPVEQVAEQVRMIAANKELFTIPKEMKAVLQEHQNLKDGVRNAKYNRNAKKQAV